MTTNEKKRSGFSRGEIEETFKALRLDGLRRSEPNMFHPATRDFGVLRDVPLTADNVTRPLREDSRNA